MNETHNDKATPKRSPTFAILFAWLIVTLPLGWGVYQSLVKSLPLFHSTASSQAPKP